jgi:hypothetical protein
LKFFFDFFVEKEPLEKETPFKKETLEKETYLVTGCLSWLFFHRQPRG